MCVCESEREGGGRGASRGRESKQAWVLGVEEEPPLAPLCSVGQSVGYGASGVCPRGALLRDEVGRQNWVLTPPGP